jgi:hypothetical protein
MASNPDPGHITDAMWYLWERLHELEPSSKLGGIYAFKSGYHSSRKDNQNNWPGNYSIVDAEDKGGPSDKAAAIDWTFPDAQAGHYDTIKKFATRLLNSGDDPGDHRLDGWREFYGQCDTDTHVEGYDFRYNQTATSDPSHLWHIHLSCDRDKVTSTENMDKLLSVLRGDDMASTGIIGLKKGDKGEAVKALQAILAKTGHLTDADVTGTYDSKTAAALLALRKAEGSSATSGDEVSGWAYQQVHEHHAKWAAAQVTKPGPVGPPGPPGPPGTLAAGTVLALDATNATVTAVTPPA